jgi:diguanylate cyclase (GGDEF)-like protein
MDYFVRQEAFEALKLRAQGGQDPAGLIQLAWHQRQRDGEAARGLCQRLAPAATPAVRARLALIEAELDILLCRFEPARERLAQAQAGFEQFGDAIGLGDTAMCRGSLAAAHGELEAWLAELRAAQALYEGAGDRSRARMAAAWSGLATLDADPEGTLARLRPLRNQREGGEDEEWLTVLLGMTEGFCAFDRSDHRATIAALSTSYEAARRVGMRVYEIRIAFTIAAALANLDDKDAALPWLERALEAARAGGWPVLIGEALATLGNFYRETGHPERGRETLDEALRWLEAAPDSRGNALAHCYAGHAALALGDPAAAERHGREAERIGRVQQSWALVVDGLIVTARARSHAGDAAAALGAAHEALALTETHRLDYWWVTAAQALAELLPRHQAEDGDAAALRYLQQACARAEALGGVAERVALLIELAAAQERVGDLAGALASERAARQAAHTLERQRLANRMLSSELRHEADMQRREAQAQRRLANTDMLTGIANRRHFMAGAAVELKRAARAGRPLALLMADIDHFKRVNDSFGHAAGDRVIAAVAQTLAGQQRAGDLIGRLGGEEFAVLLPDTALAEAQRVAERLRTAVAALRLDWEGQPVPVTMSFGCSDSAGGASEAALLGLMQRADLALYEAKRAGRNRVAVEAEPRAPRPA